MKLLHLTACVILSTSCLVSTNRGAEANEKTILSDGYFRIDKKLQEAIEKSVKNELKDPDSAKFKHWIAFQENEDSIGACGLVNAKNSYGGYTGFFPYRAYVVKLNGKYIGSTANIGSPSNIGVFYTIHTKCDPGAIAKISGAK